VDYFEDFYSADVDWQGYMSVPPFQFSAPLAQMQRIVQQNHERAPDRQLTTRTLVADGDVVVKESELSSGIGGRDVRAVAITRWRDGKIVEMREYSVVLPRESDPLHRTPQERAAVETVERFVEAYNAQEEGWFERFHDASIVYVGVIPDLGRITADFAKLKILTDGAMRNLPDRRFVVDNLFVDGGIVVLEGQWAGTASPEHPMLDAGHRVMHHYTGIYRIDDGEFVELREYLSPVKEVSEAGTEARPAA
jgi:ketosteroid isomerase-like protein